MKHTKNSLFARILAVFKPKSKPTDFCQSLPSEATLESPQETPESQEMLKPSKLLVFQRASFILELNKVYSQKPMPCMVPIVHSVSPIPKKRGKRWYALFGNASMIYMPLPSNLII